MTTISARYVAGEAANIYDEITGHWPPTSDVLSVGPRGRQVWQVTAEGDVLMAFENLPDGRIRCTESDGTDYELDATAAIEWARSQGEAWGKAANEPATVDEKRHPCGCSWGAHQFVICPESWTDGPA